MDKIINDIRNDLKINSNNEVKVSGLRFFKEEVKLYGVKTSIVRKIGKNHFKSLTDKSKSNVFSLCKELWESGYLEESFIACNWSYNMRREFEPDDIMTFERWVNNYIDNWASCDTFCNHTVGTYIEMYPDYLTNLKNWARSQNRWVKRASAVSLIVPAKQGKFIEDIFEIADILLRDSDDMVQKGYGWMLKVASQVYEKEVFEFVVRNKKLMPRTALRYAIEKMPAKLKEIAMAN